MLKRLSLYTLLLCCVPLFTWSIAWQWQSSMLMTQWDRALYWLTETASTPYALITCAVFPILLYPFFTSKKQWIFAVILMALATLLTQGVKSGLKNFFSEPRPYVLALSENTGHTPDEFYQLSRPARSQWVSDFYQSQDNVPQWLKSHYAKEVGYSFPSGHSIFAATWLMLVAGLLHLLQQHHLKAKILLFFTALWALLMLISRLRLGMHYPIDLLISVILAWGINAVLLFYFAKYISPK